MSFYHNSCYFRLRTPSLIMYGRGVLFDSSFIMLLFVLILLVCHTMLYCIKSLGIANGIFKSISISHKYQLLSCTRHCRVKQILRQKNRMVVCYGNDYNRKLIAPALMHGNKTIIRTMKCATDFTFNFHNKCFLLICRFTQTN